MKNVAVNNSKIAFYYTRVNHWKATVVTVWAYEQLESCIAFVLNVGNPQSFHHEEECVGVNGMQGKLKWFIHLAHIQ